MLVNSTDFQQKTALVTGGSRGIGREVVKLLVKNKTNVVFTYNKSIQEAKSLIEEFSEYDVFVKGVPCDFSKKEEIDHLLNTVSNISPKIHFLVNNAGTNIDKPFFQMEDDEWDNVIQVNLNSTAYLTRKLLRTILVQQGSIVNIASISGIIGTVGQVNYTAAKAGIIGFTKALSREIGSFGVRVNCVAPGYINTDMLNSIPHSKKESAKKQISLNRLGEKEEVAKTILFFLSSNASYITGQTLTVDGGLI
ncbi:3-oxoacyl-ACP reductase FabG [Bacillus sp. SM2101]|uniref:3-oxoacyl-ACP reductase FabG n=1 Tax=Bacillus sp. SM2101 TaxID=2805366 RepID=UPI001BDF53ED|nr:3-oxoacyl-ACP reductase FabG [Bacillus sp. SM2101]